MPLRILIALLALIAAPLLLLGWLSASTMRSDRAAAQRQIHSVLRGRLEEFDRTSQQLFDDAAQRLTQQVSAAAEPSPTGGIAASAALTRLERTDPMVRRMIVVNARGQMIYPPPPIITTDVYRIEEYAAISSLAASRPRRSTEAQQDPPSRQAQTGTSQRGTAKSFANPVYHVWYRDEGTQVSLWWPQSDGSAVGAMLERSWWMSELTARLPSAPLVGETGPPEVATAEPSTSAMPASPTDATALVDESNRIVYRWGGSFDLAHPPELEMAMSPPLSSWRLRYHTAAPLIAPLRSTGLYAALAGVGVVLFALGAYVLTHLQRQIRLAKNRVTFAGQVSHELRTPLTNIRLYTELAESDLARGGENAAIDVAARLAVIDTESRRLSRLVSGVLEIIRDDRGHRPLRMRPHHADKVIDDVLTPFMPSFDAAGIRIERIRGADCDVMLDSDALEMILVNLLSNIEKYAASGGYARIESSIRGDVLIVRVTDKGPGIAKRDQPKVFKAFCRLDNSISAPSGTGIGLTIASRVARRHGGNVQLVPTPEGACFEVLLRAEPVGDYRALAVGGVAISGDAKCSFES